MTITAALTFVTGRVESCLHRNSRFRIAVVGQPALETGIER